MSGAPTLSPEEYDFYIGIILTSRRVESIEFVGVWTDADNHNGGVLVRNTNVLPIVFRFARSCMPSSFRAKSTLSGSWDGSGGGEMDVR